MARRVEQGENGVLPERSAEEHAYQIGTIEVCSNSSGAERNHIDDLNYQHAISLPIAR